MSVEPDLFAASPQDLEPLAARMRPQSLDDVVGQSHLLGPDPTDETAPQHHQETGDACGRPTAPDPAGMRRIDQAQHSWLRSALKRSLRHDKIGLPRRRINIF